MEDTSKQTTATRQLKDVASSIRQRLLTVSRQQKEDFQLVLNRYGLERLIYRLTQSRFADAFVLKGAVLFQAWSGLAHRPTRDVDFLGYGDTSPERLEEVFGEITAISLPEDGLHFKQETLQAEVIKEEDEYQGVRVRLMSMLGNVRIPLQIDVGFGDAITPGPHELELPTLLDHPAPILRTYPRETVVAEKFQAMVFLGIANSRLKDFFDMWKLASDYEFDCQSLAAAIRATFAQRNTSIPREPPIALTNEFAANPAKRTQWTAFLRKSRLEDSGLQLDTIIDLIASFLLPVLEAIHEDSSRVSLWQNGQWG